MTSLSPWKPVQYDPTTVSRANQASAILALGKSVPMTSETAYVRRSGGNSVGIGGTYSDDASTHDKILLTAFKFQGQNKLDEDSLNDSESWAPVLQPLADEWLISFANIFDNACIGVTAAANGTTIPFDSIYKKVRTNGTASSAESAYTADTNYVNFGGAASAAYDSFSSTLAKVEGDEYWDDSQALVIAHPLFRDVLRRAKDSQGMPIFVSGQGADSGTPDRLFGIEVHWSRGAKTSATATKSPVGNPLLVFVGDRNLLLRGDRDEIMTRLNGSDAHDSTDEIAVKFRTRRAFSVGNVLGFAVCEKTA
ncbi:phage major capsid protein [Streptomyces tauricus]|uniref:Phage major capsid protein n=1 Tax=Streptomyces tauricus TaxID=68274 RepID=A0ABZ1JHY0_9ACTN|nr:phage major capsid protein [Streptomyces tauricus]